MQLEVLELQQELKERAHTQVLTHEVPHLMLQDDCRPCRKGRIFHLQQCGKGAGCEWHRVFADDTWQGLPSLTAHFYGWLSWHSLSTFLLPALKHKYSQLHLPETPPLLSGLLLSEEQAAQRISSEII